MNAAATAPDPPNAEVVNELQANDPVAGRGLSGGFSGRPPTTPRSWPPAGTCSSRVVPTRVWCGRSMPGPGTSSGHSGPAATSGTRRSPTSDRTAVSTSPSSAASARGACRSRRTRSRTRVAPLPAGGQRALRVRAPLQLATEAGVAHPLRDARARGMRSLGDRGVQISSNVSTDADYLVRRSADRFWTEE